MNFKTSVNRIFSNKYVSVAITLFILIACSLPGNELPSAIDSYDKLSHFIAFAGWAFCWQGTFRNYGLTIILGVLYGIFIEIWQSILPESFHRHFDWNDALADSIGVLIGIILWKIKTLLKL